MKRAILVASFGTTCDTTREKTIGAIENSIKSYFSDFQVNRAFTSSIVLKRLSDRGININNVENALKLLSDYDKVIIQPTHIIDGYEYEKIIKYGKIYKNVVIGKALLYNEIDYREVADFLNNLFSDYNGSVVMMGHGSEHISDNAYRKLQTMLNDNIFIATVEGKITLEDIMPKIKTNDVLLTPFMIVCGEHANNDLSVDWKNYLEDRGYKCELLLKGLGEYKQIQNIFIEHIKGEL